MYALARSTKLYYYIHHCLYLIILIKKIISDLIQMTVVLESFIPAYMDSINISKTLVDLPSTHASKATRVNRTCPDR